jgi:hypothetical protein
MCVWRDDQFPARCEHFAWNEVECRWMAGERWGFLGTQRLSSLYRYDRGLFVLMALD